MKIVRDEIIVDLGNFSKTSEYALMHEQILEDIRRVVWPTGSDKFTINPGKHINGVLPIKDACMTSLESQGWHNKFKTRVANELKPMIPERAILMSTNPDDIVLDPFGGGGSTFQMAEKNGRFWIGSEVGPCEPIAERLQFFVGSEFGAPLSPVLSSIF